MDNNKCPGCGGTLVFDPDIQRMVCDRCSSMFAIEAVGQTAQQKSAPDEATGQTVRQSAKEAPELMEVSVYNCQNCGAILAISDAEIATRCAYCGEASIVFSRIEKRIRPQAVIPFKISKKQALINIRKAMIKSDYITEQLKNFEPELLRGIYVPYGMFCYHARDKRIIRAQLAGLNGHIAPHTPYRNYFREADAVISHIPVDASYRLPNESADRLEPYFGKDLVPFSPEYLSGFYADLCDEDFALMKSKADARARTMFEEKMDALPFLANATTIKSSPSVTCTREIYALLPVWFLVFQDEDDGSNYTIMVNGQTGKVVGAVPTTLPTFLKWLLLSFLFLLPICIFAAVFCIASAYALYLAMFILFGSPLLLTGGIRNIRRLNKSVHLTTAGTIRSFAAERQD